MSNAPHVACVRGHAGTPAHSVMEPGGPERAQTGGPEDDGSNRIRTTKCVTRIQLDEMSKATKCEGCEEYYDEDPFVTFETEEAQRTVSLETKTSRQKELGGTEVGFSYDLCPLCVRDMMESIGIDAESMIPDNVVIDVMGEGALEGDVPDTEKHHCLTEFESTEISGESATSSRGVDG